jgi:hypothetical protein
MAFDSADRALGSDLGAPKTSKRGLIERRADSDSTVYGIRSQRCLNALAPLTSSRVGLPGTTLGRLDPPDLLKLWINPLRNPIDPILLAAISIHETGRWKSRIARQKNNWMGLMTPSGAKSFGTAKESIFYAAKLLNRKPFKSRNTLSEIAPVYCTKNPRHSHASILHLENQIVSKATAEPKANITPAIWRPDVILKPIGPDRTNCQSHL